MTVDEIPETFMLVIGSSRACSEVGCAGQFRTVVRQQRVPAKRR
jgi:hypothetical protein